MPRKPVRDTKTASKTCLTPRDRVIERLDLTDFISQYTKLDKRGRGSCPFHPPDVHPSFAVNQRAGYWYCFHERKGGDLISFYARLNNLSYAEALHQLRAQLGGG